MEIYGKIYTFMPQSSLLVYIARYYLLGKKIFLSLFLVMAWNIIAQDKDAVGLVRFKDERKEVDRLVEKAYQSSSEEADKLLIKALKIAWKIPYLKGLGKIYNAKGLMARRNNEFVLSVQYHKRAMNFLENSDDTLLKINNLNNLAVSLRKLNMESEAMKYYMEALELAKEIDNKKNIAMIYHGIGNVYVNLEDYTKALDYFFKALQLERNRNNKLGIEYDYANIAEVYILMKKFDKAKAYLDSMMVIARELYGKELGIEYNLFGKYFFYKKNYANAIDYYRRSLDLVTRKNIERYMSNAQIMLGKSLIYTGYPDKRQILKYIHDGTGLAKKIGSKENIILGYDAMVAFYLHQNDYRNAYKFQKLKEAYKDSMINLRAKKIINTLEILHETHEKDNRIKTLAREKEQEKRRMRKNMMIFKVSAAVALAIIILLLIIVKQRKEKSDLLLEQKNREIQNYIQQLKLINAQLQKKKKTVMSPSQVKINEKTCSSLLTKYDLTPREQDVLNLICEGKTNDEIARSLFISKNTVKSHIRHIYEKLDVKNRSEIFKKISG